MYINSIKSINSIKIDNEIVNDTSIITNTLKKHFSIIGSSSFVDFSYASSYTPTSIIAESSFSFRKISPIEVHRVICELKEGGAGPDGIEARFIKLASHILMYPLANLFNMSLSTCSLPAIWKCAKITPLYKGGDPLDVNNYRPISIISSVVKNFGETHISPTITVH